ncbi:hypothetical protein DFH11DRAFT_1813166 [Phellopilus nigrolimitatus]|nr:hypothetical protein DFH11DRAFT_1813166 [Phellopilus nigrolimitatus]
MRTVRAVAARVERDALRGLARQRTVPRARAALDTTLSIYDNNGDLFDELETEFKSAISSPDSNLRVLLYNAGTSALHATFYSLGIGRGDGIIVPVYTFMRSLMQLGVVPVFVNTFFFSALLSVQAVYCSTSSGPLCTC